MNKKIVFFNPPGKEIFIRDYYCSKISKTGEVYFPLDLIYQTGYFKKYNYEILVIDAIAEKLTDDKAIKKIIDFNPMYIYSVSASVSFNNDIRLFSLIKKVLPDILIFLSADYGFENQQYIFDNYKEIDGFLLDFTGADLIDYIENPAATKYYNNLILKTDRRNILPQKNITVDFELPLPDHTLFQTKKYQYPFSRFGYCRGLLASYGCPYNCSFCIFSYLPYKVRKLDNVLTEIEDIRSLGINELHFDDQTFHTKYSYSIQIAEHLIKTKFKGGWVCFLRTDYIDFSALKLFKKSGLHTAMVGIETANDSSKKSLNKNISSNVENKFMDMCKEIGIDVCATFILGLPEETKQDIYKTIDRAITLNPKYASFNTAAPKPLTVLKKKAVEQKLIGNNEIHAVDQNLTDFSLSEQLSSDDIIELRKIAYKRFYFRLSYIIQKLKDLKSLYLIKINIKIAFRLFFRFICSKF